MRIISHRGRFTGHVVLFWLLSVLAASAGTGLPELKLPGTQPMEHDFTFHDVALCIRCHSGTTNGPADPYFSWQGGMMAQSARDPVFRAALAIANNDLPGSGEYCIRCHSPRGWFEGRSTAPDGSLPKGDDLNGVSCDVCHRLVDPFSEDSKKCATNLPPGYGDGMMVLDPERTLRGPYAATNGLKMHDTLQSPYQASSELCGNCHNVSNPTLATNVDTQPPYAFGHIERTYSEWALSDYAKKESLQSCQSCHFPRVAGGGKAVKYDSHYGDQHRDYFVSHNAVGGSTWVQDAVYKIWKGKDLDREALNAGKQHAKDLLKTAAALGLEIAGGKARMTITNLTGHKLPTGYPEGRRMWVNVLFFDANSKLLKELGHYGDESNPGHPTLSDSEGTRVYECKPGLSASQAAKHNEQPGPSFHFILNDVITKDNRIPPRGFKNVAFAEHLAAPIGAEYADGQYWDEISFDLPAGTAKVEVKLMYQSVSAEYMDFLHDRDPNGEWSKKLYDAWLNTGKCPPEEIASIAKSVGRESGK
jgi:hypothetical protein